MDQKCRTHQNSRFLCFRKGYNVKIVFWEDQEQRNLSKIHKNRNEITDRKHGAEMLPNGTENGAKWDPKSEGNRQETLPSDPSEELFENGRSWTAPPTPRPRTRVNRDATSTRLGALNGPSSCASGKT